MMTFEKLNKLVASYQDDPSNDNFYDMYEEAKRLLLRVHTNATLTMSRLTIHDALELFDEAVMHVIEKKGDHDYGALLSGKLKFLRYRRLRDVSRRNSRYSLTINSAREDNDETYTPMYEVVDETLTEETALEIKDAQKRQLLDILADRVNDPVAKRIATHTVDLTGSKQYLTDTALAKELNMCHKTVGRKLNLLAQQYRKEKDGDIRDYFPIGIRVKKEFISA